MHTKNKSYPLLELTPAPQPCNLASATPRPTLWRRWVEALLHWLTNGHEPTIRCTTLTTGEKRWRVFDPTTDTTLVFESEEEVLTWLETAWIQKIDQPQPAQVDLTTQMRYRLR